MRIESREIILCLVHQGYYKEAIGFMEGKFNINIYDWNTIEICDAVQEVSE